MPTLTEVGIMQIVNLFEDEANFDVFTSLPYRAELIITDVASRAGQPDYG